MADHESIQKLAAALVADLTEAGKAVSTAESCTGGWVAKAITDIPGASAVFHYGIVSYSNGAKEQMLGVQNSAIEEHGSVSEAVVGEQGRASRPCHSMATHKFNCNEVLGVRDEALP